MKLVRFLLAYGHFIDVLETIPNANKLVDRWESGGYALASEKRVGGVDQLGRRWSVLTDQIVGMLMQDPPQEVQQALQQQPSPGIKWPLSGRN